MKQIFTFVTAILSYLLSSAQVPLTGNPIVSENSLPGNPISEWGVPNFRDTRINGFATKMSLNAGETVHFKIDAQDNASYTIKIYRIGYYNGDGARLIHDFVNPLSGTDQPEGISDPVTGLVDCNNWSESVSWAIPSTAVSGLYIAKLERTGGGSNHIAFIIRNDASTSDLYLQFPDAKWQAYNAYGGANLYNGNTGFVGGRAVKVSYNRPFFVTNVNFNTNGKGADWYMHAEYPLIRWLERNGYDITYTCSNDVARNANRLLQHKAFITVGHDEYVSKPQRDAMEAARNAGVHMAFFSGNEVYWKTRWEGYDGSSEDRTLVCYKEGTLGNGRSGLEYERTCGNKCDNTTTEWTGLWRTGGDYDAGRPENALTGQISWYGTEQPIEVSSQYKKLRFWRNTSVANLANGQKKILASNTLGFECDFEQYTDSYPSGRITMSETEILDPDNNNAPTGNIHKLSLYRHSSGALVFGAGTVQWSWGLDGEHFSGTHDVSQDMQQATVNLFADMGAQPVTLQNDLIVASQSTDLTGPISTIASPADNSSFPVGTTITINGSLNDAAGVVTGIEISTDNGVTWRPVSISGFDASATWSYTWTPSTQGNFTIKTRGFDDSGNRENAGAGTKISIISTGTNIFQLTDAPARPLNNDGLPIELGMKFKSSQIGFIKGIRFYKGAGTTGIHTGQLYSSAGNLLAEAVFVNETLSGWQQILFSTPVPVIPETVYVAAYHSASGDYPSTRPYFTQAIVNGPLQALADGDNGHRNGLYLYTTNPSFPTEFNATANYWVDVVFETTGGTPLPVSLISFSATPKDNSITLRWSTATEINNRGFEVQRSTNGLNWSKISFIAGVGNSNSINNYIYEDKNLNADKYYYRLRQIDFDEQYVYSPIVSAWLDKKGNYSLEQNYPNPFRNETVIKFFLPRRSRVNLSVFDMTGKLIKVLVNETKDQGSHAINFNIGSLSRGLYYYKMQAGEYVDVKKMTIQ